MSPRVGLSNLKDAKPALRLPVSLPVVIGGDSSYGLEP